MQERLIRWSRQTEIPCKVYNSTSSILSRRIYPIWDPDPVCIEKSDCLQMSTSELVFCVDWRTFLCSSESFNAIAKMNCKTTLHLGGVGSVQISNVQFDTRTAQSARPTCRFSGLRDNCTELSGPRLLPLSFVYTPDFTCFIRSSHHLLYPLYAMINQDTISARLRCTLAFGSTNQFTISSSCAILCSFSTTKRLNMAGKSGEMFRWVNVLCTVHIPS